MMNGNYSKKIEPVHNFDASQFKDIEKVCIEVDCQTPFIYSALEQKYFMDRQLKDPARCKDCRQARKLVRMRNEKY